MSWPLYIGTSLRIHQHQHYQLYAIRISRHWASSRKSNNNSNNYYKLKSNKDNDNLIGKDADAFLASIAKLSSETTLALTPSNLYNSNNKASNTYSTMNKIRSTFTENKTSNDMPQQAFKESSTTTTTTTTILPRIELPTIETTEIKPYRLHINSSRNNTLLSFANPHGNVLCWSSGGSIGLRKAQRGTSDAASQAAMSLTEKIQKKKNEKNLSDMNAIHIIFKGFGPGREQAFRILRTAGMAITMISDVTPIRHGGCRPRQKRSI